MKTLCNFEPQIWPEMITSRDAEEKQPAKAPVPAPVPALWPAPPFLPAPVPAPPPTLFWNSPFWGLVPGRRDRKSSDL